MNQELTGIYIENIVELRRENKHTKRFPVGNLSDAASLQANAERRSWHRLGITEHATQNCF